MVKLNSKARVSVSVAVAVMAIVGMTYVFNMTQEGMTNASNAEDLEPENVVVPAQEMAEVPSSGDVVVTSQEMEGVPVPEDVDVDELFLEFFGGTNDIRQISSHEELVSVLEASSLRYDDLYGTGYVGHVGEGRLQAAGAPVAAAPEPAPFVDAQQFGLSDEVASPTSLEPQSRGFTEVGQGVDYSTTNIQVDNVDEPDYLKNDSKYVYIVSENTLSIIDAYPAEDAELVLKVALDVESDDIDNMFLNGDRLVMFYSGENDEEVIPEFDYVPVPLHRPVTHALIVDVSDRERPTVLKDYVIYGDYADARMIGNHAYFVTENHIDHDNPRLPIITEDSVGVIVPDAFYFDIVEKFSNFNTLTAIDIFGDAVRSETFLMGHTGTFYVSENNFYLTYQQDVPFGHHESSPRERFHNVIVPLLPGDIQDQIRRIQGDSSLNSLEQWEKISELLQDSYNRMGQTEKKELMERIRVALSIHDMQGQERIRTVIHKIAIGGDMIEYVARGSVPGMLLNQFSMDESGDRFRVATTVEYHSQRGGTTISNAVYVLDGQLGIVGDLEGVAPNESIFASRFMGDRLYLVTFEQIDPFFVIDLSADTPEILGELKIPGFSDYLHPFDDDHVIGIGRDTTNDGGWVQETGVKISLFNVKDVSNPRVLDDIVIGDEDTYSEAGEDHRAFFFDRSRGVLSIPISAEDMDVLEHVTENAPISEGNYWDGFYVLDVDSTDGFRVKGTITHTQYEYDGIDDSRTFYIGDVLYTASEGYLKMHSFDNMDEINSIKLKNTGKFIHYLED